MTMYQTREMEVKASRARSNIDVVTKEGVLVCPAGSWVVEDSKGDKHIFSDDNFNGVFEPAMVDNDNGD